ncbi:MAG: hypothetical protein JWO36_5201 [Myxococcales bacterium]|nr:hypothetical protein [Myxococcales bacterium]
MKYNYVLGALLLGACGSSSPQVLSGRVAPGFPSTITAVKVLKGATVVATAPVSATGAFRLSVPPGTGLTLRLVGAGKDGVVFPRTSGTIQSSFAIRGGGVPFDLGQLHFVGSSTATTFAFHTGGGSGSAGTCDDNGHDANGATCVDDGDQQGGTCDAESESDSETTDGADSGSDAGSDATDTTDGPDQGDAVADHNFPADGCADGGDNGGDDGTDSGSGT